MFFLGEKFFFDPVGATKEVKNQKNNKINKTDMFVGKRRLWGCQRICIEDLLKITVSAYPKPLVVVCLVHFI